MASWGSRLNLSGHREATDIYDALVADALVLLANALDLMDRRPRRVVDLGSGAGFPGLPIAIAIPEAVVELVEARRRRHHFQRAACRQLSIENARPRLGRIEDLDPTRADLVVAQAVGPIADVITLATPWVEEGGWLVVPTGATPPDCDPGPGWVGRGLRRYRDNAVSGPRSFWYAQRISP